MILLLAGEFALHSDAILHRFRSVFAAGRAMDKLLYVEQMRPSLLIMGNSRVDNGFDPATVLANAGPSAGRTAFNLGLPGANASVLYGIARRLDADKLLGPGAIRQVVIGLDEGLMQGDDSLGYLVFFGDRSRMLEQGDYLNLARSMVRGWGYATNLKQLREPAKLGQFVQSAFAPAEPLGGGAAQRLGYRPGFSATTQDAGQVMRQEAGSTQPPSPTVAADFIALLDLLHERQVKVSVVFPPLLTRQLLYLDERHPAAAPYLKIRDALAARGVPMVALGAGEQRNPEEFINAGHLNDRGAQRFSAELGRALADDGLRTIRVRAE
ncbi:MAG TPA: hypothetical protein VJ673_02250 [Aromatoleum sp.]|uniref:hypothetical protein n=1 Tax=Aromatoleum sp. TaxID=2307007 RepID=UPI002B459F2F|nr:hypothetical protein [Aromatoleum sp.]HJV24472.1 hypothetical protein [Aromatoleum sp.]